MNVRPDVSELVDAVREHLTAQVLPALADPRLKFQTLVAAHVLSVIGREIATGRALDERLLARFAALLGREVAVPPGDRALGDEVTAMERALCDAIASGAMDDRQPALHDALVERVEAALAVWNPGFLARAKKPA